MSHGLAPRLGPALCRGGRGDTRIILPGQEADAGTVLANRDERPLWQGLAFIKYLTWAQVQKGKPRPNRFLRWDATGLRRCPQRGRPSASGRA